MGGSDESQPGRDIDFARDIYDDAKRLFPQGAVEALISRPPGTPPGGSDPAVQLHHLDTGITIVCADFPTQIENYIAAAIRLRVALDERGDQ